ncbi:glucose-1-phosphate cytidylyltransferase [Prochlorococcus marinus]|uniref:glucose-1-phosphate cytidylyltransferase n=1 Tax=Prochlorococcus TaxID=1218 RepID=UPI0007B398D0|nr:glucose-1-phosphate cytidylyltransferase [Prochlorococcus marinus]
MKAVILAGGLGTRLSEETHLKPKPMVEIGGKPILWHIMKIYSHYNINDFVICCGYKGYLIKEYFANYFLHTSDVTFDLKNNEVIIHKRNSEPWRVTLLNTGINTNTGGRLRKARDYLEDTFCFTYGDGLADVNINSLVHCHIHSGKKATLTAVQPPGRFGLLELDGASILRFQEKPMNGGWINGGFFVLEPEVLDLIIDDHTIWEQNPLEKLASNHQLNAYFHSGFWHPMDTLRDKQRLNKLWDSGSADWKVW